MSRSSEAMAKSNRKKELELHPDAWARFERFIRDIAKAGPQHRATRAKANRAKSRRGRKPVKKSEQA